MISTEQWPALVARAATEGLVVTERAGSRWGFYVSNGTHPAVCYLSWSGDSALLLRIDPCSPMSVVANYPRARIWARTCDSIARRFERILAEVMGDAKPAAQIEKPLGRNS